MSDPPCIMFAMQHFTFLADLRAQQRRQRSTLETALAGMVAEPLALVDMSASDATELQVRLAAADLLAPHEGELAAFELIQARYAARRLLSRHVDSRVQWAQTAADSLSDRLGGGDDDRFNTSDPDDRDKLRLLRDALALLQAADAIATDA